MYYNVHRVAIKFEFGQSNQICQLSLPGGFTWQVCTYLVYKVLKYYVELIFVINSELLECWQYLVLGLGHETLGHELARS